ncbi:hypothetical protein ABK730_15115 [Klebsiella indica]|uniref:Uncharacterized protein n=1 Tax=Klebsiella indica TaxID=2582917 RepID=A0A5R9LDS9_9ENTR|nr:hypothetical protein [Klebsiella sp. 2680]TLV11570.1 hypothetical protein FE839_18450 [Klebsiella indica]
MRTFGAICDLVVDIILNKIACILFVACATAIVYGNFPARRIIGCEKQGVTESICVAAEWDSEKVDLLPAWDPENLKMLAIQKNESAAGPFKS